jgi:hypothetical protein
MRHFWLTPRIPLHFLCSGPLCLNNPRRHFPCKKLKFGERAAIRLTLRVRRFASYSAVTGKKGCCASTSIEEWIRGRRADLTLVRSWSPLGSLRSFACME